MIPEGRTALASLIHDAWHTTKPADRKDIVKFTIDWLDRAGFLKPRGASGENADDSVALRPDGGIVARQAGSGPRMGEVNSGGKPSEDEVHRATVPPTESVEGVVRDNDNLRRNAVPVPDNWPNGGE